MSFYAVFQNWIFKVECHVGEKLFVSGPQTWLSVVLKQIDCYHFAFLAVHFCHPTTCYPLRWDLLYVYGIRKAILTSQCVLCFALAPKLSSGGKEKKNITVFKACRIMGSLWGSLQYNSSLKTPEQTILFYSGWIGRLEGLTSLK